jgi:hypothetical protein
MFEFSILLTLLRIAIKTHGPEIVKATYASWYHALQRYFGTLQQSLVTGIVSARKVVSQENEVS